MDLKGKLNRGMRIVGADQTDYGTVERYDDDTVYVGGHAVPYSAFERVDQDRLYVGPSGARYFGARREPHATAHDGEVRIPVIEERIDVSTRVIEIGNVEVHKSVEAEQISVPIELRRDQIEVRQVSIAERPAAIGEAVDAFTEGTIRVPVRAEEAVVSKEAIITGEVAVGRKVVTGRQTVRETLRQLTVEVTASYDEARAGFRQHFDRFQARLREAHGPTFRARDFADAEPNYRAGFEARNDPRNADRPFEDVEPALRQQHVDARSHDGESWDTHREEVRAGWEQGRG